MELDKSIGLWVEDYMGVRKPTPLDDLAYHIYCQWNLARNTRMQLNFRYLSQLKFILFNHSEEPTLSKYKKDYIRFYEEANLILRKYKIEKIINEITE